MKQLRDRARTRLQIFAMIVLGFIALGLFTTSDAGRVAGIVLTTAIAIPATLTDEDKALAGYVVAKAKEDAESLLKKYMESTMTIDTFNTKLNAALEDAKKKLPDGAAKSEDLTKLEEKLIKQGEAIQKLKENGLIRRNEKSLGGSMVETYVKNIDKIVANKRIENASLKFNMELDLKTVGSMIRANANDNIIYSEVEPGLANIQSRRPFLREIMNVSGTSKGVIYFSEKSGREGTAGATGEGLVKNQIDFNITVSTIEVKKVTAYIKVSEEMLDDIDYMAGEIDGELVEQVNLAFDTQLMSGTGLTIYLKGLTAYITSEMSVDSTVFDASIQEPNNMDVLRAAVALIINANFQPTYILMNPLDVAMMELSKDANGQYVLPPFIGNNGKAIAGVPIVENTGVTQDKFLVGDFQKCNLRIRKEMELMTGYSGTDFIDNVVTIRAELRAAHYIKTNHLNAFQRGTFSTLKSAMTAEVD